MPAPTHVIIVSPLSEVSGCTSVLGLTPTSPIYTEADPVPRTATHKALSGGMTTTQRAAVDAHIASPNLSIPNTVCTLWLRSDPSPYAAILDNLGLTTDPGTVE